MKKKCTMTDTSTIHTNYDIYGFYTTYETERTPELDHPIGEQIPYCKYWKAVREISDGYEPTSLLGYQQWSIEDTVVFASVLSNFESTEGVDECDWWVWNS